MVSGRVTSALACVDDMGVARQGNVMAGRVCVSVDTMANRKRSPLLALGITQKMIDRLSVLFHT